MKNYQQFWGFVAVAIPAVVSAEVSDKMPTVWEHWQLAFLVSIGVLAAGILNRWLGIVAIAVPILMIVGSVNLAFFDDVGHSLYVEQGTRYFLSLFGSNLLVALSAIGGIYIGFRRHKRSPQPPAA